jgi:predicted DCC family thiol-disulfide oxidoreductase YuxK
MSVLIYLTVNQFTAKHTAFNTGGLRSLIFNEHQNGLAKSGAIVRIGRKVLIEENLFFSWVQAQNKAA